jgi:preprotein translocase subunit SecA
MYDKLAGMTGTAKTEEEEFIKIYGMEVVVIPTNEPLIRDNKPDLVFKDEESKFRAVVEEIEQRHEKGQPLLVGTVDIDKSEKLSRMLNRKGIQHNVLNAKNHKKEAEIIKDAGQKNSVTIATNMAGRGTDIVLGEGVVDLGGLHVIGTERHESRRIDNQLRGRAGRQGDPGSSQFFVSLEDDLLRLFGSDNITALMDKVGMEDDQPIQHKMITSAIERAQKKVEGRNFDIRKAILQYDDILNKQRQVIYDQRSSVLFADNMDEIIFGMLEQLVEDITESYLSEEIHPSDWDLEGMVEYLNKFYFTEELSVDDINGKKKEEIRDYLIEFGKQNYKDKEAKFNEENMNKIAKYIALRVIDRNWMSHLDNMDELRQGIGLRAYGQKDPLTEYKFESFDMFNEMTSSIREDIIRSIFRIEVHEDGQLDQAQTNRNLNYSDGGTISALSAAKNKRQSQQQQTNTNKDKQTHSTVVKPDEPGRNDPCPCGSGKKYKKCCGR